MPLYCSRCKKTISADPKLDREQRCPECGSELSTPSQAATSSQVAIVSSNNSPDKSEIGSENSSQPSLGPYNIVGELGRGGMGRVYKGIHRTLRQVRAIKVLSRAESRKPKKVARFEREARIVAGLNHPNIVQIFEFSRDPTKGYYYFVMEFVDGGSVATILKRSRKLPWQQAVEIGLQVTRGLQEMYEHNLIHRDIKPSNILIDRDGTAKLADLGLARQEGDEDDSQLTGTGVVLGTLDYMSPEQIVDSRKVDIRSDLYALGSTLFQMLTGQVPFPEGSTYQKLQQHLHTTVPDVGPLAPDVPFQLVLILNRLTSKDLPDRYQTPNELISALTELLQLPDYATDFDGDIGKLIPTNELVSIASTPTPIPAIRRDLRPNRSIAHRFGELPLYYRIAVGAGIGLLGLVGVWLWTQPDKPSSHNSVHNRPEHVDPGNPTSSPQTQYKKAEEQFLKRTGDLQK